MDNEITQEQELEASRELKKSKLQDLKEKAREAAKKQAANQIKKAVSKKIWFWILSSLVGFFAVTWWFWLILLFIIILLAWIINDPMGFLNFFGATPLKIFWDLLR
ncbi:MAG: hypothetical protein Athens101410_115 [Parcubacteria group bacterium Athens1014_10]|nr:MAG: hypothetical protein Athens101410_115 [Parcubacteria group bacterium Athens1014_10]TSD05916.1 MAG: hypothetical protein Athens071412_198 [Parcubacteria group bacterium Athens0714_12]